MVLFLNYLPYIIVGLAIGAIYGFHSKLRKNPTVENSKKYNRRLTFIVIATIASLIVLAALTAGYIPKAGVPRIAPPDYSEVPVEPRKVEDRLRKPTYDAEQSKKRFDDMVDWRKRQEQQQDVK